VTASPVPWLLERLWASFGGALVESVLKARRCGMKRAFMNIMNMKFIRGLCKIDKCILHNKMGSFTPSQ
jgi:hypothetical protein